jgi:hypothetical protein
MRRLALLVLAALWAFPARADPASPGGVTQAPDGKVAISPEVCRELGADADYVPGVDVNGNKVAPADLPSATPPLSLDNFPIEISARFAGQFGVPAAGGAYRAKAILGYVTVQDGRALFNGKPLAADANAAIIAACHARKG